MSGAIPNDRISIISTPTPPTRIYRYEIRLVDVEQVEMPQFAKVLTVAPSRTDDLKLDVWAAVDPEQPVVTRTFYVVGTGAPLPPGAVIYHGTAQTHGGALVWHLMGGLS